jgi:hypothetical protein
MKHCRSDIYTDDNEVWLALWLDWERQDLMQNFKAEEEEYNSQVELRRACCGAVMWI